MSRSIAFIGLGNMGSRMATNLIKKGITLKVYDVSTEASKSIENAQICASPHEAVNNSSLIFTMLPDGDAVRSVVLGEKGIGKQMEKKSLLIDCSTIEPHVAREVYDASKVGEFNFVDAPVSGGITGAAAGTLTFMVGGDDGNVKEAMPYLNCMGSRVLHCGGPGAGQIAKLCNNLVLGISMVAVAEGMNLGAKLGLDLSTLAEVINTSSGRCWSSDTYNPVPGLVPNVPSGNAYSGGFSTRLMAKDLALAEGAAVKCGAPIPLGSIAHQLYRTMLVHGYSQKDFSAIYAFLKGD